MLAVTLTGCGGTSAPASQPTAANEPTIANVVGQPGNDAKTTLTGAGYVVEFDSDNGKAVILSSNWTVLSQDPAVGTPLKAGSTVKLTVTKPAATSAPVAPAEATSTGLTGSPAQAACDNYANAQFPYGYNPAWVLGSIAQRVEGDHWFMKYTAKVKNQFDAKREVTIECTVGGTDDTATVVSSIAY